MIYKHIRIHGDNIVECERTLNMIYDALGGTIRLIECPVYMPVYEIITESTTYKIELLSGHGRWGVSIGNYLMANGGILREGADSYICEVIGKQEQFLLAIEYCSALPAGNNAWQRNGRALSSVLAGIPYLFMAELGGVELNENREVIAARSPNPLVPFSYLSVTKDYNKLCTPVYRPHPSITDELYNKFSEVFGYEESLKVIKGVLTDSDYTENVNNLMSKSLRLIEILSGEKRGNKTLKGEEWTACLNSADRANWILSNSNIKWYKKTSKKVKAPDRIKELISYAVSMSFDTIGASDIPICLIPQERISEFEKALKSFYPKLQIKLPNDKHLAVVWITGYKPKGDDSRPDRGLCPMAKMVMGESCRIISMVYGPAKPQTWKILEKGLEILASSNGLWQSIYKICDGVLIDSSTKAEPEYISIVQERLEAQPKLIIPYNSEYDIEHSEHDTDTAIHQILTRSGLAECLCNPPGGDWSGISYFRNGNVYRWTSLPRVSEIGGKRPDHVFQQELEDGNLFISIESKGKGSDLENEIGTNLVAYLQDLFSMVPTSIKRVNTEWRLYNEHADLGKFEAISVGAFIYKNEEELQVQMDRGKLDAIMAFEFKHPSVVHMLSNDKGRILEYFVKASAERIGGFEIKIH
ncbi:MAG: hypothetical protein K2L27_01030 [Muribaculaceae bacterium]|nr:hypothetical protein [Muribaculaceae bacterium]